MKKSFTSQPFTQKHAIRPLERSYRRRQIRRAGRLGHIRWYGRYASRIAVTSRIIDALVEARNTEEIYAQLAIAVRELLTGVDAVVIGLYGGVAPRIQWVYALQGETVVPPEQIPTLLQMLAASNAEVPTLEPRGIFSGGQISPQPAAYAPMTTKEEFIGEVQAYRLGGQPFSVPDQEVLTLLASTAAVVIQNQRLSEGLQRSRRDLFHAYDVTLESLARALELRDRETEGHTRRVAELAVDLGKRAGMQGEALVDLRRGAQLHDIGKMGIPDGILLKTQSLTSEEWAIMRKHTEYALDVLQPIEYLKNALDIPHYHHEKWDGSGYPKGLKGEEIPLAARVFAIVDVWDALTSDRPYRKAWPKTRAIFYMRQQSGKHFDPRLLAIFLTMMQQTPTQAS
jgi:HD-GYP domain-containing protein (c-di-GMP phosphodiesterase class II)